MLWDRLQFHMKSQNKINRSLITSATKQKLHGYAYKGFVLNVSWICMCNEVKLRNNENSYQSNSYKYLVLEYYFRNEGCFFFPHQASLHPLHLLLSDLGLLGNQANCNERKDQRAYTNSRTCQVSFKQNWWNVYVFLGDCNCLLINLWFESGIDRNIVK